MYVSSFICKFGHSNAFARHSSITHIEHSLESIGRFPTLVSRTRPFLNGGFANAPTHVYKVTCEKIRTQSVTFAAIVYHLCHMSAKIVNLHTVVIVPLIMQHYRLDIKIDRPN